MSWIPALIGAAILVGLALDVFVTTLTLRGGGWLTKPIGLVLWRAAIGVHRRRPAHRLLAFAGGVLVTLTLMIWVALLWLGWALIFAAGPAGVAESATGAPADLWSRVYFAGFNLFTLGLGDYRPVGHLWQMLTVLAGASGMLGVTLSISYFVPVLSGVVARRTLAGEVRLLGRSAAEVAERAARSEREGLSDHFSEITRSILQAAQQHLAYPVLHYFHAGEERWSLSLALARLDAGLRMALEADTMPADRRVAAQALRHTVGLFLVAVADQIGTRIGGDGEDERRRLLAALVENDGWNWDRDVWGEDGAS